MPPKPSAASADEAVVGKSRSPIIHSPFEEPDRHWRVRRFEEPKVVSGRRESAYYYRVPERAGRGRRVRRQGELLPESQIGEREELVLVNTLRRRVAAWRKGEPTGKPYDGVSPITRELLQLWRAGGERRRQRLFFAQLEAAETVIFLTEAAPVYRKGLAEIPRDEPGPSARATGRRAFTRFACKMATGSGKTTVMGMLIAWSVLNRQAQPGDEHDHVGCCYPSITASYLANPADACRGSRAARRHALFDDVRSGRAGRRTRVSGRGRRDLRVRVKTAKGRKLSSTRWLERQLNDPYVARAREDGYRGRAAYKIMELDDKFRFLVPGARVVDLGAAPGGWCQVAVPRINALGTRTSKPQGRIIGVDLQEMEPIAGAELHVLDFLDDDADLKVRDWLDGKADVVMSDMAPFATGHKSTDHLKIMALVEAAAYFAFDVLDEGGVFVAKVLAGGAEGELMHVLKRRFEKTVHMKPPASRSDSSEKFVVAQGFRGNTD